MKSQCTVRVYINDIPVYLYSYLNFLNIINWRSKIMISMGKRTMGAILYTISSSISVMNAHACLIVS